MAAKTRLSSCGVDHSTLKRLAPGIYEDDHGRSAHFCLDEVCEACGMPPTPENLAIAEQALRDTVAEHWPGVPVIVSAGRDRRGPDDPIH